MANQLVNFPMINWPIGPGSLIGRLSLGHLSDDAQGSSEVILIHRRLREFKRMGQMGRMGPMGEMAGRLSRQFPVQAIVRVILGVNTISTMVREATAPVVYPK